MNFWKRQSFVARGSATSCPGSNRAGLRRFGSLVSLGFASYHLAMSGVPTMGLWGALAAGVLLASAAGGVEAAPPIPARLALVGPACSDVRSLQTRIELRTKRVRFVERDPTVSMEASIEGQGAGYVVRLSVRSPDAEPLQRRFETPRNCEDALDALALVVAIGLDQWLPPTLQPQPRRVRSRVRRRRKPRPERSGALGRSAATPVAAPLTLGPLESRFPSRKLLEPARSFALGPRDPFTNQDPRSNRRVSWGLAVGPRLLGGVAPGAMPGARVALRLALADSPRRASVFWPEVSFALSRFWRNASPTRGEEQLDFELTSVGAELCPVRFGTKALGLRPCASLEAGQLRSTGRRTFGPIAQVRGFRSAGVSLAGRWSLGSLQLGATARAGFAGPPDRFTFGDPSEDGDARVAHAIRPWVWEAGLALGWGLR